MRAIALRYALAPACVLLAVLVHLSPASPALSLAGLFVFAVLAAAWFGGAGPGFVAAVLATFTLPQLIAVSYPLLGGFLDLPRFITFAIEGLAVGWGSSRRARVLRDQERYARAMSASDDGFWDWIVAGDTIYTSPRLLEIYGFAPDTTFAGRNDLLAQLPFHPEDRPQLMRAFAEHFAGETVRYDLETRFIRDGETHWVHLTGVAARDPFGAVVRWTGTARDVTERKRAEQALRLSGERYALAVAGSYDGVWDVDFAARSVFVSARARELAGMPLGPEMVPMDDWFGSLPLHPEDVPRRVAALQAHLSGKAPVYESEFRLRQPDGVYRWRRIHGVCVRDADGNPQRMAGSISDVDARRRAENALQLSQERYALAMEAAGDGHIDWDLVSGEFYISPRLLEMLGYVPGTSFTDRADWVRRFPFHPEDRPKWEAAVAAHFAGRESHFKMELRIVVRGEVRWTAFHFLSTRDAAGTPIRWTGSIGDITEQKRVEEALRASEERYSLAMEASEEGYVDSDIDTDQFVTSERMNEIFGIPRGKRFADRSDFLKHFRFYGDDAKTYGDMIRAVGTQGGPDRYESEFRIVRPSGEVRWLSTRNKVKRDAAGRARRRIGVVADITERKLAEEALRESEALKSAMFETALDCIVSIDHEGRVVEFNPAAERTFGYRRAEALGKELAELIIPPRLRAQHRQGLARYLKSGEGRVLGRRAEMSAVRADGSEFPVELTVTRIATEGAPLFTAYLRDITERKRIEEALRQSEQRYELAMAASQSGYWDWDIPSDRYFVSPRAYEMGGYPPGSTWADRDDFKARVNMHPEDFARWEAAREKLFAGTGERLAMEVRYIVRGETRWHMLNAICRRDDTGKVIRWTGSATDVTARKLAEEALHRSEERYSLAMDASEEGHFDLNIETGEIFVSERLNEIYGFAPGTRFASRDEYLAQVRLHGEDVENYHAVLGAAVARHGPERYEFDFRIVQPSGQVRWLRTRGKVTRDAEGRACRRTGVVADITEARLAAEELRESEARFRTLTELSSDWYWKQDEQLRFAYMPNHATALGGYTDDFSLGKRWWELEGLAPLSTSWAEHQAVLAARQLFRDVELRRVTPDGSINYLSIGGAPMFDEQGRFKGYQGVGRNITERKRIEEELRSRQEMLGLAQKSAQAIAFEWRTGANRLEHNRWSLELAAMHGITPQAYDGSLRHWKKLIHTEDWPAVREAIKHALHTGEVSAEYRVVHPDGTVHWLHARGRLFFDSAGKAARMVGFMHDVTQRRHAEEALRLSEERYALAVASADEGIFDWDLLSDRVYVSQRARALFALPVGELWHPRREWRRILNYHPEDIKLQRDSIKALIAGETSTYDVEFRVIFPDSSVRWFRQRAIALRDAAGKAYRMVGSVGDVTDRKRAQEELQRLERQLRQAQRLEAMGTLAGGIAHDFNNILGAILGYGEMALRGARKGSRLARDVDSIIVAGERGRALVDRVLAFSRSGVGERVAVHVEKVVREALDFVSAKLPPNITLHAKLRAGRSAILGDATQVHQVLMNLATNAVHAMPEGGTLRVSLDVSRIDASQVPTIGVLAAASEYLVLRVADTGTGIAPDILERIFDPFFTTKEVGTGTGLGLSLVHGIIAELGGAIDVASTPGAGSTFTVYLPRSGETVEPRHDEPPEIPRGDGQRVLIVDDEEPLMRLATRALEELGYAPVGFTSSSAALAAFRADPQRFDAVITDERMPGLSGSALIREVRGIRDRIPIVLMSGYVGAGVSSRAREAGAEEVLKKPLSARDLATSLARVLRP
jgi:PAS domain S-box-containing protein